MEFCTYAEEMQEGLAESKRQGRLENCLSFEWAPQPQYSSTGNIEDLLAHHIWARDKGDS